MATLPEVTARLDADVSGFISAWEKAAAAATQAAARINAAMASIKDIKVDVDTDNLKGLSAELGKISQSARQAGTALGQLGDGGRRAGEGIGGLGNSSRSSGEGLSALGQRASSAAGGVDRFGQSATKASAASRLMGPAIAVAAGLLPAVAAAALATGAALQGTALAAGVVALGWRGIEDAGERLKASMAGLQKQVESVFRSGLSQEFTKLGQAISSLDSPIKNIASSIVGVVKEFTGWIRSADGLKQLESALGGVDNFVKALGPGAKAAAQAFTEFGSAAAPAMDEIGQAISSVFENLTKVIQKGKETGQLEKAFQAGAAAIEAFGEVLAGIVDILIEVAGTAGEPAANAIKNFGKAMQDAAPAIGTLFGFLAQAVNILSVVVGWFMKLSKALEPVFRVFNQAGDSVTKFIKALSPGSKELEKFGAAVTAAFGDKLGQTVKKGTTAAIQAVKDWWTKTTQDTKQGADKVVQAVKEWWTKTVQDVKSGAAKVQQEIKQWWTKAQADTKAGTAKIIQAVKEWWQKTVQDVKAGVEKAKLAIKEWWDKSVQEVKAGADKIIEIVKQWWDDTVESVKEGVDKVVETIKELPQKAIDALNPWKDDMKAVGKDAMDGMAEGIKAAVGNLVAAATAAAQAAMNAIKTTLGIASPSRVFRDEVGAMIPAGIAQGIIANAGLVTDAMRRSGLGALSMGGASITGTNIARSTSQQTFNLRVTGGSDTAVGTMIQRLAQQGKLKITSNAVVGGKR